VDLRVATQIARRGDIRPLAALDGEELAEIRSRRYVAIPADHAASARAAGLSPVDWLEAKGKLDPREAATVRAAALKLPLWVGKAPRWDDRLLPPALRRRGVGVVEAVAGGFVLACARPTPALAREAAQLLPGWGITWCVVPGEGTSPLEERHAA
jgi:hypothetical protein